MLRLTVAAGLLAVCAAIGGVDVRGAGARGNNYDRGPDFEQLGEWVRTDQSFTSDARDEALRTIAAHQAKATRFSDAAFYMEVRRIVGLAENGHSNVSGMPVFKSFGLIPIRTYWFADGLHIVRTRKDHEHLLGARIDAIEGMPVTELESVLMKYHGGNRNNFRRFTAATLMLSPALMHAIGRAGSPERLALEMTGRDGVAFEATLAVDPGTMDVRGQPWRYLHPAPIAAKGKWSTIHDDASTLPLFLQQEKKRYRYEFLEDGAVAYIQLRGNIGLGIESFVAETRKRLKRDRPRSIILDNRHNPGGDLGETAEFALDLPTLVGEGGHVYVITDGGTFSAGIYTSFYPKVTGGERTIVVGEHVGDWTRFWAESGPAFQLLDSGYRINYALRMHDIGAGCHDREVCHMSRDVFPKRWNMAVGSLEPDWPVPTTFADFEACRDRPLERILEHAAGS